MTETTKGIRNRIVGTGNESPEHLLANPRNWRIHPRHQQVALESVLDEVGWVQQVIVNKTTGYVIDGHLRVALAISREEITVPVVYVELTPEEERLILASFDPIGDLAAADREKLAELMDGLAIPNPALDEMLSQVRGTFAPSFDPSFATGEVTDDQFARTADNMAGQFERNAMTSNVEVTCPHCGEDFLLSSGDVEG